jgi:hypothetical protein
MGKRLEKGTTPTQLNRSPSSNVSNSTAVKVAGVTPWIHHSHIKKAAAPQTPTTGRLSMTQLTFSN